MIGWERWHIVDMPIFELLVGTAGVAAAGAASVYVYATREARDFRLEHVTATAGNGGQRLLKILHLSDLHLCHPEKHKLDFLRGLPVEEADLVVITGDVFEDMSGLQYARDILRRRPRYGAYAVLGNHDYYDYTMFNKIVGRVYRKYRHPAIKRDVQPLVDALADGGIKVLRHESVYLEEPQVCLIGIDYPGTTPEHLQQLAAEAPDAAVKLALIHVPRRLHNLVNAGIDFAFAGHTHGGQVCLPGLGAIITDSELPRHEASGIIRRDNMQLHVSRGIGADPRTNFRLFCPPHAVMVELRY
jgi:predicted MPP superfamily phosphohydrolase